MQREEILLIFKVLKTKILEEHKISPFIDICTMLNYMVDLIIICHKKARESELIDQKNEELISSQIH
jgi:hypothetical protein